MDLEWNGKVVVSKTSCAHCSYVTSSKDDFHNEIEKNKIIITALKTNVPERMWIFVAIELLNQVYCIKLRRKIPFESTCSNANSTYLPAYEKNKLQYTPLRRGDKSHAKKTLKDFYNIITYVRLRTRNKPVFIPANHRYKFYQTKHNFRT